MSLKNTCLLIAMLATTAAAAQAQSTAPPTWRTLFRDITLHIDTAAFNYPRDTVMYRQAPHLAFQYRTEEQVAELRLTPADKLAFAKRQLALAPAADYDLLDSLVLVDDAYYRCRLRFKSISKTDFLQLTLVVSSSERTHNLVLRLLPYTQTQATFYPGNDDLYIGEEKSFELVTNSLANLKLDGIWKRQGSMEYRLTEKDGRGYVHVLPVAKGAQQLRLAFEVQKPYLAAGRQLRYALEEQVFSFTVRESRLRFLRPDLREIVREQGQREGVEIQMDSDRLQIQKTYRIEDQEERGGPLVAELYTVRRLSNDKMLCLIRPYLYHRISDGYLFIKDGDQAQFITNIDILPEAKISKISILRKGQKWTADRAVMPGETVEVRIEGEGLGRARFYFEDLEDISADTLTRNDKVANYLVKIPVNIRKNTIDIYNAGKRTGASLAVKEYERPRPLDFVYVDYGDTARAANTLNQIILYPHTIRDIVLSFDASKIDRGEALYGKQLLEVEVRISGGRNELVEMLTINNIEVCPDETSPRGPFYQSPACNRQPIPLNSRLARKTHSLDDWSRINITIRHRADRYGGEGYTQRIEIVRQKLVTFDIDLSFPAGLVIKKIGVDGFPGLGGISLAMLAQFSFYDKQQVKRLKPFKIGAGFLAQNAFNFNADAKDRDLGIVLLGSLYPTRKDAKLSFPLYGGFGYFLNESKFFFLIGPGIRVNF